MLSSVVLPEPVPPVIRHVEPRAARRRSGTGPARATACRARAGRRSTSARRRKRRIERIGPSSAAGGMIALTREPSGRRASTSGVDSSMRRPTREMMRSMIVPQVRLVAEAHRGQLQPTEPLDVDLPVGVDQDVADLLVEQQRRDRSEIEGVVQQLGDQPLLVAAGEPNLGLDQQAPRELLHLGAALASRPGPRASPDRAC